MSHLAFVNLPHSHNHVCTGNGVHCKRYVISDSCIFILNQGFDHSDVRIASFFAYVNRCSSGGAFITPRTFGDCRRTIVLPFIQSVQRQLGSESTRPAHLLMGSKAHLSEVISIFPRQNHISLSLLPSQSSRHLLPLD
jgi:hypothetical protein